LHSMLELDRSEHCGTEHYILPKRCVGLDLELASLLTTSQNFCNSCRCGDLL
jgi:hypothetical protein